MFGQTSPPSTIDTPKAPSLTSRHFVNMNNQSIGRDNKVVGREPCFRRR